MLEWWKEIVKKVWKEFIQPKLDKWDYLFIFLMVGVFSFLLFDIYEKVLALLGTERLSWLILLVIMVFAWFILRKIVKKKWWRLITVGILVSFFGIYLYFFYQVKPFSENKIGIYIAQFDGDSNDQYRDKLYETYINSFEGNNLRDIIEIRKLNRKITFNDNQKAEKLAEAGRAQIVLWGKITHFQNSPNIYLYVTCLIGDIKRKVPISPPAGFDLQRKLDESGRMPNSELLQKPLALVHLAIAMHMSQRKKYDSIYEHLKKARDANSKLSQSIIIPYIFEDSTTIMNSKMNIKRCQGEIKEELHLPSLPELLNLPKSGFTVVVDTFSNGIEAFRLAGTLRSLQINSLILPMGSYVSVCVGSYEERRRAEGIRDFLNCLFGLNSVVMKPFTPLVDPTNE